jgi:hypothetical protein
VHRSSAACYVRTVIALSVYGHAWSSLSADAAGERQALLASMIALRNVDLPVLSKYPLNGRCQTLAVSLASMRKASRCRGLWMPLATRCMGKARGKFAALRSKHAQHSCLLVNKIHSLRIDICQMEVNRPARFVCFKTFKSLKTSAVGPQARLNTMNGLVNSPL